ncbi:bifunctional acetate--CoA ligase family protein/GNAT family N-acetyltransferase [Methylonatrum kenyense]|uniref:bifunctional acetate--CoA ligase family protein/GNAT family N-acetyltransferase n=1 Tax=Methylonatrum kenyense TaxID=455253 RepID=UPI0020BD5880|nr:bifunctional acetate--CoA ligase family protein/GNAT family N-acetyltransferase [Methylonatrum kenyense]MCK8515486.1 bifunctional acetate--CoA ligase family protein/GNAT family N-acetyltransferase [Methylonatrum kenyense]
MSSHYLDRFFRPRSIALVGASDREGSVGTQVLRNLQRAGFTGALLAVNPSHRRIGDLPCVASVLDLPETPDLAIISIPARAIPTVIDQCGQAGIRAAVLLAPDLAEGDQSSSIHHIEALRLARLHGIRLIGPDWAGLLRPASGLIASFGTAMAQPGRLALISQSGALSGAILDWAPTRGIGFSTVVSLGETTDVDVHEILDYLALDPQTRSILLYLEQVNDARGFLSGLRAAARLKPVIVMKSGHAVDEPRPCRTHARALIDPDKAFDAAIARAGAVRVPDITRLLSSALLLAGGRRLAGDRIAVLSNGHGPGRVAGDVIGQRQLSLATLSDTTRQALRLRVPRSHAVTNPVDMPCEVAPGDYAASLEDCLRDGSVDGAVAIFTPQNRVGAAETAEQVTRVAGTSQKPVLACWMGGDAVEPARQHFSSSHFPSYGTPENAVEALAALSRYRRSQALLAQLASAPGGLESPDIKAATAIVEGALQAGLDRLTPEQAKAVLQAFRIPVTPTRVARSRSEACEQARSLGFPVALKINSAAITRKMAAGGVHLNLVDEKAVARAWDDIMQAMAETYPGIATDGCSVEPMHTPRNGHEIMLGVARDPVFGPVIGFGAGGSMVEAIHDIAVSLPPLNDFLARDLIRRTRLSRYLDDGEGLPLAALEQVLLRLSDLVCSLPSVTDVDINPMIVDHGTAIAVDARIHICRAQPDSAYRHMAIMPYPANLAREVTLRDGSSVLLRPIRPEDADMEAAFVRSLSPRSRYLRFMEHMSELSTSMLVRFTQIDYDREMALVALSGDGGEATQVGVARYIINPDGESCEFALVVSDDWQGRGLGRVLMEALMHCAEQRGLSRIEGQVLSANQGMLALMQRLGFERRPDPDDNALVLVERSLDSESVATVT